MKNHCRQAGLFILVVLASSACSTLRVPDRFHYEQLESKLDQTGLPPCRPKDPKRAERLNYFIGIGNIYLGQWNLFLLNYLSYPWSIFWAPRQAGQDAETINKLCTIRHYLYGPGGPEPAEREQTIFPQPGKTAEAPPAPATSPEMQDIGCLPFELNPLLEQLQIRKQDFRSGILIQPFLGSYIGFNLGTLELQTPVTNQLSIAPRLIALFPGNAPMSGYHQPFSGFGGGLRCRYYPWGRMTGGNLFAGAVGEYITYWNDGIPPNPWTVESVQSAKAWATGLELGYSFAGGEVDSCSWALMVSVDLLYQFKKEYYSDRVRETACGKISPGLSLGITF